MEQTQAFYFYSFVLSGLIGLMMMVVFFKIYKKAKVKSNWMVFIPIFPFSIIPFFHSIDKSAWQVLKWFIPVAGIYFIIKDQVEFYKRFGLKPAVTILLSYFIPFAALIIFIYIAFSKEVEYEGKHRYGK
jgi:hypothetical protein